MFTNFLLHSVTETRGINACVQLDGAVRTTHNGSATDNHIRHLLFEDGSRCTLCVHFVSLPDQTPIIEEVRNGRYQTVPNVPALRFCAQFERPGITACARIFRLYAHSTVRFPSTLVAMS